MTGTDDFDRLLKDELDPETLRNTVVGLIWRNDLDGLRRLCRHQITLSFFLEKIIDEITPDNHWNDVLFLIARRLIEAEPSMRMLTTSLEEKKRFVRNQSGGREILAPFVQEEQTPTEFTKRLELVAGTHGFTGLDALVAENPNTTATYVRQMVAHHGGKMRPDTREFQLLCEMGVSYRNHHHRSDLLDLLQRVGGKLNLLHADQDIGSIQLFEGWDVLHRIHADVREARLVLHSGHPETALDLFEAALSKLEPILAGSDPFGDWEYANALLFSGILFALKGNEVEAQNQFLKCMKIRFLFGLGAYGTLLLINVKRIRENSDIVRNAFSKIPQDVAPHLMFDFFFEQASGHNYSEMNQLYDHFRVLAGDRKMKEASTLSEQLLGLYAATRNALVPYSICELTVRIFRACYFSQQGDLLRAEQEYIGAYHHEVSTDKLRESFKKMSANPEKILTHYFGE